MMKDAYKYFGKHVMYNSTVHFLIGVGVGMLLVGPVFNFHTVRWGLIFLGLGILGHLYPLVVKK